jgi:nitrogen fixation/metabolism regulation signal transduction histidine kinase
MKRRSRSTRIWLGISGVFIVLLMGGVFTLGSLRIPFDPEGQNQLVVLYALSTFIVVALLTFGLVLGRTLLHLWVEHRAHQFGSRFKTKMVLGAMAVSLFPLIFLFFVSYALMNRTLNRWFPRPLEVANAEAQALMQEINRADYQRLAALAQRAVADGVSQPTDASAAAIRLGAEAAWIVTPDAGAPALLYSAAAPPMRDRALNLVRTLVDGTELWQSRMGYLLAARASLGGSSLVAAYRLPPDFLERYDHIAEQTASYDALYGQIQVFKRQILLTLGLFTVLLLFVATWFAVHLSKQMIVPMQALAEATRQVAAGRFDTQVEVRAHDEIGTLVRSFNEMTTQLADNRRQIQQFTENLQQAVQELDRRRLLIETVLESIPTGVLSLDASAMIQRANSAAREIFGEAAHEGGTLAQLAGGQTARDLQQLVRRSQRMGTASKELRLRVAGRVLNAAVTVSSLGSRPDSAGYIVVVDDLTDLLRAQKAAAWQEVAQRIAHEIKNPLTPIQLSAERLRRYVERNVGQWNATEMAKLVGECSALIASEVGTLEGLVNEFSQFARFPAARLAPADPNDVMRSALDVFDGRLRGVSIETHFAPDLPLVRADVELLRRVIVNLIDNAAEAMEGSAAKHLELATRSRAGRDTVEIIVADTGHGISPEDKEKLFLPHFSTRDRGTGLGLAIASRVIAEHNGVIRAEDNVPIGARFVIELPAAEPVQAALLLGD